MPDLDAARRDLEETLGADAVLSDPLALRLYARDASMVEGSAGLVVFPTSTDHVVACVRTAAAHDLHLVPRGSGTGLTGGSTPIGNALVVVTSKMDRILEIRAADRLAWVEPGLFNLDLGAALRGTGFTYMPDPSSQQVSSIGGNVATNAGGPHASRTASRLPTYWPSTWCSPTGPWPEWAPRVRRPPGTTFAEWSSARRGPWGW